MCKSSVLGSSTKALYGCNHLNTNLFTNLQKYSNCIFVPQCFFPLVFDIFFPQNFSCANLCTNLCNCPNLCANTHAIMKPSACSFCPSPADLTDFWVYGPAQRALPPHLEHPLALRLHPSGPTFGPRQPAADGCRLLNPHAGLRHLWDR